MSQTAPAPESEEMQKTLLRLAWECDFNTFQEAFEQASPQPDLEWRGTLPELYDRDNLYRRPFKTPMRAVDIACLRGHWETAFYLLERGADWQYTNEHGTTLLHFVLLSRCNKDCRCYHQCPSPDLRSKILNRLLENDDIRGIINSRTQDLDLLHACDFRLALACGTNGASAIEIAAAGYGNDQETPRLLIDKGAIRAGLAHLMIKTRYPDVKMVEEYLKAEAPLTHSIGDHRNGEELDEDGNTILHSTVFRASMHGEMDIFALLELMLDMGFRPCKNNRGETVWDIACTKERPYLLGLLSERELRDEEGQFEDMDSWPQPNYEYVTSYLPLGQWSPHIQNEERIVASIIENNMINVLVRPARFLSAPPLIA
ncbi:hypothetical protein B0I35DRAFT_186482 [Stachybotrys elegans]|uniref:Uncharacterized protein n=1 Tax=Stachybotrys elegans TaxID=80388 RepID=A0A8K0SZ32_9HYPO|nr:hypothetical protein B0I35DRAFT_186482 [Stachybotrys elegans]